MLDRRRSTGISGPKREDISAHIITEYDYISALILKKQEQEIEAAEKEVDVIKGEVISVSDSGYFSSIELSRREHRENAAEDVSPKEEIFRISASSTQANEHNENPENPENPENLENSVNSMNTMNPMNPVNSVNPENNENNEQIEIEPVQVQLAIIDLSLQEATSQPQQTIAPEMQQMQTDQIQYVITVETKEDQNQHEIPNEESSFWNCCGLSTCMREFFLFRNSKKEDATIELNSMNHKAEPDIKPDLNGGLRARK